MINGKILVLIADNKPDWQHDCMDISGLELKREIVPLVRNFSHEIKDQVGNAKLSVEGKNLYAEVTIFPPYLKEFSICPVIPAIGGKVLEKKEGISNGIHVNALTKYSIDCVSVSLSNNSDSRIKPQSLLYEEPPIPSTWRSRKEGTRHVYDRTWGNSICYKSGRLGTSSCGTHQCTLEEWHEFQKKAKRVR